VRPPFVGWRLAVVGMIRVPGLLSIVSHVRVERHPTYSLLVTPHRMVRH
jgi:hypothetical protein